MAPHASLDADGRKTIDVTGDFTIKGGRATANGSASKALAHAGTDPGTAAGETLLFQVEGASYPIEVIGTVKLVNDANLAPALFVSTAPPLNLDPLLAQLFKSLECAVFASGTCVVSWSGTPASDTTKGTGGGLQITAA